MGYLDGWWGRRSDDPLQDLDPRAREFLKKESPVKYEGSSKKSSPQDQDATTDNSPLAVLEGAEAAAAAQVQTKPPASTTAETNSNALPSESQYRDGRYGHLWKTYRPQSEVDNETKTDAEKLSDVIEAFKARKAAIGTAALENCADEQMDWSRCMREGSLRARMTMCSDEVRKFERCFNMQSRLLKTLGYLNAVGRSPETDERIQLHADKLYHQMIEQDAAVELAKKEGLPEPTFEPVMPKPVADAATEEDVARMTESVKKRSQDKLKKLSAKERAVEEAAIEAEMRSKAETVARIKDMWKEQEAERLARIEKGEGTLWDKATSVFKSATGSSGEKKD